MGPHVRALSVHQPHAGRIAAGEKTIEVRCWRTRHRGPLLICATKRPRVGHLPLGVALCIVEVLDVREFLPGDEAQACIPYHRWRWAWVLRRIALLRQFPVRGRQRVFRLKLPPIAASAPR